MIASQFKQLLYSKTMDTALVAAAECAEVGALVDEVYQSFLGHELNNNSGKTQATLKIILLNLYSSFIHKTFTINITVWAKSLLNLANSATLKLIMLLRLGGSMS